MKRILFFLSSFAILTVLMVLSPAHALADFPYLKVNVIEFTDAEPADVERVAQASELIEQVVNSNEFRDQVLNMKYSYTYWSWSCFCRRRTAEKVGYSQTDDSPEQVLSNILRAQEIFEGGNEGVLDYYLDMYYTSRNVIGYTARTDKFIHMNRKFHRNYSPAQATANLFHEWLHKIGYGHTSKSTNSRPHSVPYKLGYLVGDMAAAIASNGDPVAQAKFREEFAKTLADEVDHE